LKFRDVKRWWIESYSAIPASVNQGALDRNYEEVDPQEWYPKFDVSLRHLERCLKREMV
jgi:hypothetical protein